VGSPSLKVIKRSSKNEPFDSDKLQQALKRVCRDRPQLTDEDIRRIARSIEAELVDGGARTVRSGQIAELALKRLADVDKLAYNRLAANYLDDSGRLRTDGRKLTPEEAAQLGLFEADDK
jgi:transcriptional repressor NrdR